jgi:hypothetical protein
VTLCVPCVILQCVNVTLCVPCIILQCVYKPTRCTNYCEKSLFFSLNDSTCFGLSSVHRQQRLISCTVQLVHSCRYVWLLYGYRKDCSPKHVEPINEKIKIIHKNLCISLIYIHIQRNKFYHIKNNSVKYVQRHLNSPYANNKRPPSPKDF